MAIYAKYEGIDGESKDAGHRGWIELLSLDWCAHGSVKISDGKRRRRGRPVVEDMMLTLEYEKVSPKLQERCLQGVIVPRLEIELTAMRGDANVTYLRYELKNVQLSSYQTNAAGEGESAPVVVVGNRFEEIGVIYTEYDETGSSRGDVASRYKIRRRK